MICVDKGCKTSRKLKFLPKKQLKTLGFLAKLYQNLVQETLLLFLSGLLKAKRLIKTEKQLKLVRLKKVTLKMLKLKEFRFLKVTLLLAKKMEHHLLLPYVKQVKMVLRLKEFILFIHQTLNLLKQFLNQKYVVQNCTT